MFIPMLKSEATKQFDFVFISGDAYVDHPSFANALICRLLEKFGYSVALIAQPSINNDDDFLRFGKPKYAFLVSSGNIESMVNHYYVSKKKRKLDEYSPGGKSNRPDRAVNVYTQILKRIFPDVDVIIGGVEASLRRFAHYDFWADKVLPSIILSSGADLLVYGMGEKTIVEIADYYKSGLTAADMIFLDGTAFKTNTLDSLYDYVLLSDFKTIKEDKKAFVESFKQQQANHDCFTGKTLVEKYHDCFIVQNKPRMILTQLELDELYNLKFMRKPHPSYREKIPAFQEIEFSINVNRGCNGSCTFCAITYHQGRQVQMRSQQSCVHEAEIMKNSPNFKGYIHDVGGPTANFNDEMCMKLMKKGACAQKYCLGFKECVHLKKSHDKYLDILTTLRNLEGIKKVFIRSGIRYDYAIDDYRFIKDLAKYHVSGQLRLAPEHISDNVLYYMNKPSFATYESFVQKFNKFSNEYQKKQFVVPYLISSHPGSTLDDACELALYLNKHNLNLKQVQDFYPTPGTLATVMYYTELDPWTFKKIYVAKTNQDKLAQRALLQFKNPKYREIVIKTLQDYNKQDLLKKLY